MWIYDLNSEGVNENMSSQHKEDRILYRGQYPISTNWWDNGYDECFTNYIVQLMLAISIQTPQALSNL